MIKIVLDTNIIISAALSPSGNCARIINLLADTKQAALFYAKPILAEYQLVLSRPQFGISPQIQEEIMEAINAEGKELKPIPSDITFIDESDRIFYDTAQEAGAILITGNKKHYPDENFIMTPVEFLRMQNKIGHLKETH